MKAGSPGSRPVPTVAAYIASAPRDKREALRKVRRAIRASAPKAVESLSYGLIGYKYQGKPLIGLGYWKEHCALYGGFAASLGADLTGYTTAKGTLRFPPEEPPSDALVRKIVRARMKEIDAALLA